jgi:outer membrane protein assembly factor BamB
VNDEPRRATVQLPGAIRLRMTWGTGGRAADVFALSEVGGAFVDLGELAGPDPDALCRAEVRAETPGGSWTVRLASRVHDEPRPLLWDSAGLLVLTYGFHAYAFEPRSGAVRWTRRSGTPFVAVLGSSRLDHVLLQSEVETFAVAPDGETVWRVAHTDVVTAAEMTGGRLVLTSFGGAVTAIDPATGRSGD